MEDEALGHSSSVAIDLDYKPPVYAEAVNAPDNANGK
jgi:hypothetical protein